jgi:hypothetical protein
VIFTVFAGLSTGKICAICVAPSKVPSDFAAVVRFVAALGSANPAVRELFVRPGVKSDFAVAAADGGIAMREVIDADAVDYFGRLRSSGRSIAVLFGFRWAHWAAI